MNSIYITHTCKHQLHAWAIAHYPHEACGLMIGHIKKTIHHTVAVRLTKNINQDRAHDRFLMDPMEYQAHENDADAKGLAIIGIWHTHPDHPAIPSETDRQAAFETWSYIIISVNRSGINDFQSYRLIKNKFIVEEINYG